MAGHTTAGQLAECDEWPADDAQIHNNSRFHHHRPMIKTIIIQDEVDQNRLDFNSNVHPPFPNYPQQRITGWRRQSDDREDLYESTTRQLDWYMKRNTRKSLFRAPL